jgi:hypothetical protein
MTISNQDRAFLNSTIAYPQQEDVISIYEEAVVLFMNKYTCYSKYNRWRLCDLH